jgi:hypothetical protein
MTRNRARVESVDVTPVHIIADGALMNREVGHGRMCPVVLIDMSARPDLSELVRLHEHLPPGDVVTQWGFPSKPGGPAVLQLTFTSPARMSMDLIFPLPRFAGVVDSIFHSQALYIRPANPGDTVSTTMDLPTILIEVPASNALPMWMKAYESVTVRDFRSRGLSKSEARAAAREHIERWRELVQFRLPT